MSELKFDPEQAKAIELMLEAKLGVVTGPPGVGKTTCIRTALERFDGSVALCAPTGKAAKRMTEATDAPAQTIHRLLQWSKGRFLRNEFDPLDADLVICDESSMLDLFLAADLTNACSQRTRVVFVGDVNQLPPVGPGMFLRDTIASKRVPTAFLGTLHRAAQGSWIYRNAPKVLAGKGVETDDCDDFQWYQGDDGDMSYVGDTITEIVKPLDLSKTQVLTPMRVREGGSIALNKTLQAALNPGKGGFALGWGDDRSYARPGDPVIQTRNNYQMQVFNGETGIVKALTGNRMVVDFDGEDREYDTDNAGELELAYTITIHKSQGSEWENVVVLCHSAHRFMLNRQLIYTAITRAKKRVFLVGDNAGFKHALASIASSQRNTRLRERIEGTL